MADRQALRSSSLDPAVLDKLSRLSLVAQTVVEGFMGGAHRSPHRGSSIEFAQHREYVAGDDPRFIDEKIFAKSNRLVVKEFIEETNFAAHLLVDRSASMGFSSIGWSKLDYARWCAAALTYLVVGERDAAGLVLFDREVRAKVPPANGAAQIASILAQLEAARPEGETGLGDVLKWLASRLRRRGIVIVFSDFLDDPEPILDGVRRLRIAGHDPILFQILDPQELSFDYQGQLRLDGLEGGGRVKIDAKSLRAAYREVIGKHNRELARAARGLGVDWLTIETRTPLDVALSAYLAKRLARVRGRRG